MITAQSSREACPITDSKAVASTRIGKNFAVLDIDETLILGDCYNETLIKALLNNNIKDVYLFSNMRGTYHFKYEICITRPSLIQHLQKQGLTIHGVVTPNDYVRGLGNTYHSLYKPVYDKFFDASGQFVESNDRNEYLKELAEISQILEKQDALEVRQYCKDAKLPEGLPEKLQDQLYILFYKIRTGILSNDDAISEYIKEQKIPLSEEQDKIFCKFINNFVKELKELYKFKGGMARKLFANSNPAHSYLYFDDGINEVEVVTRVHRESCSGIHFEGYRVTNAIDYEAVIRGFVTRGNERQQKLMIEVPKGHHGMWQTSKPAEAVAPVKMNTPNLSNSS